MHSDVSELVLWARRTVIHQADTSAGRAATIIYQEASRVHSSPRVFTRRFSDTVQKLEFHITAAAPWL